MVSIPLLNTKPKEKDHEEYANIPFKHWLTLRSYRNKIDNIDSKRKPKKVEFMFDKSLKLLICGFCSSYNTKAAILITNNGEKHDWCVYYEDMKIYYIRYIYEDMKMTMLMKKNKKKMRTKNEDDDNTKDIKTDREESLFISYYPHKIDWSNTRVIKVATNYPSFLVLTDDGKINYIFHEESMYQMDIKEKITCIACGHKFYMIVTENGKIYNGKIDWDLKSVNIHDQLDSIRFQFSFFPKLRKVELPGKVIVKIACGNDHTLALTDKGEVYAWDGNWDKESDFNKDNFCLSPTMVTKGVSDIAAIKNISAIKSNVDGLVYIWGSLHISLKNIRKPVICEHTNIFDVCNSMTGYSPISMVRTYAYEEYSILNDLEAAFNDRSTSDLTIAVKEQPIYVHKTVLKLRSPYFRTMFQSNWIENNQSVIKYYHHSYVTFKTFLKYLYTGTINLSSIEDLLDLLKLADEYCEYNLERDCIRTIKKGITVSNIFLINETALQYNKMELEEYCFDFFLKNITDVIQSESFTKLDIDTRIMFITKANSFFTLSF